MIIPWILKERESLPGLNKIKVELTKAVYFATESIQQFSHPKDQ